MLKIIVIGELRSQLVNNHFFWCQERCVLMSGLHWVIMLRAEIAGALLVGIRREGKSSMETTSECGPRVDITAVSQ